MFHGQVLSVSQDTLLDFQGNSLTIKITQLEVVKGSTPVTPEMLQTLKEGDTAPAPLGMLGRDTAVQIGKGTGSSVNLTNVQKSSTSSKMFRPDFSFSKMGIGGLDHELGDIFRRVRYHTAHASPASYAKPGTDLPLGATRRLRPVSILPPSW